MSDPVASEKAAELATAEKIDLADVKGTGSEGLIKVDDVRKAIADRKAAEDKAAAGSDSSSSSSEEKKSSSKKSADPKMPERAHAEGCPMDPARVEVYEQTVPPKRRSDGAIEKPSRQATMAHCCDCGNTIEV